jgi:uncharacterized lipoprotein YddW (UPF0748 family)
MVYIPLWFLAALTACAAPPKAFDAIEMQPTPGRHAHPPVPPPGVPTVSPSPAAGPATATVSPPPVTREFRAAWISSVGENSWLAQLTGKSTAEQKAALVAMLDRAVQLKLNAVIFQVRPSCDALYVSPFEPWSEYLTGTMGKAPQPFYDPLAFVIDEAHRRGLELHAWFNPYRAHHADARSPIAANHISRTRPDLVRRYGKYLWLDPGEPEVQDYSLRVVLQVVKRYDIDAVHFDDYFYPYREKDGAGRPADFPDDPSWAKFGANGKLARDDWRRENVNRFIQRVQTEVHAAKPWVKFGISPFGIWRPGNPPQIKGKDAYAELYADARKWIISGWADYFAPQLYWSIGNPEQSFPVLLKWWSDQNPLHRHLWPGLDATKVGNDRWTPEEIAGQIRYTRQLSPPGQIIWGMRNLMPGRNGLAEKLAREIYSSPAIVPATPWLAGTNPPPSLPRVWVNFRANGLKLDWQSTGPTTVRLWALQSRHGSVWKTELFPGNISACTFPSRPDVVSVTAIDRWSRASLPVVVEVKK